MSYGGFRPKVAWLGAGVLVLAISAAPAAATPTPATPDAVAPAGLSQVVGSVVDLLAADDYVVVFEPGTSPATAQAITDEATADGADVDEQFSELVDGFAASLSNEALT